LSHYLHIYFHRARSSTTSQLPDRRVHPWCRKGNGSSPRLQPAGRMPPNNLKMSLPSLQRHLWWRLAPDKMDAAFVAVIVGGDGKRWLVSLVPTPTFTHLGVQVGCGSACILGFFLFSPHAPSSDGLGRGCLYRVGSAAASRWTRSVPIASHPLTHPKLHMAYTRRESQGTSESPVVIA
jgi:hypothetical protein